MIGHKVCKLFKLLWALKKKILKNAYVLNQYELVQTSTISEMKKTSSSTRVMRKLSEIVNLLNGQYFNSYSVIMLLYTLYKNVYLLHIYNFVNT